MSRCAHAHAICTLFALLLFADARVCCCERSLSLGVGVAGGRLQIRPHFIDAPKSFSFRRVIIIVYKACGFTGGSDFLCDLPFLGELDTRIDQRLWQLSDLLLTNVDCVLRFGFCLGCCRSLRSRSSLCFVCAISGRPPALNDS